MPLLCTFGRLLALHVLCWLAVLTIVRVLPEAQAPPPSTASSVAEVGSPVCAAVYALVGCVCKSGGMRGKDGVDERKARVWGRWCGRACVDE